MIRVCGQSQPSTASSTVQCSFVALHCKDVVSANFGGTLNIPYMQPRPVISTYVALILRKSIVLLAIANRLATKIFIVNLPATRGGG